MPLLYRIMALVLVLAPLFAAPAGAQAPERRFALVIGNSEYKSGRHPTAANDAGLVAETLRTAGFDVAGARDLDQETLRRSIREFLDKVSAAGPQAVSFIYLAGYGLQFEGENYFVPIDASIARDEDIPIETIRMSDFVRPLVSSPGGVKLVVVDAARQHPYMPAGTPLASGLALVDPDASLLIAFNTAPGSVAPVENGPYGAFAQALAEMIATGGLGLDDVFARVRLRVNETTGGVAVPWYASKVTQAFLFTEPTPDAPAAPQQVATTMELQSTPIRQFRGDQEAYIAALDRDTIAGYQEFIAAFPDSVHIRRIRALIAVRREAIMWRRVFSFNTREAYWSYLERYPQGAHVADAERRLARLAAAYDPPPAFVPMAFADIPPPPPDEVVYLAQPQVVFEDPVFVPPPPMPAFFCPPRPPEFVALPPPPPPVGAFFLPTPVVSFFSGPRPWVRPPSFVVAPPPPPVQEIRINNTTITNITTNNTTIVNERPAGGAVGLMSPTLPSAVVTRVNSGALHVPPPAPPAQILPPVQTATPHPGVGVLGTQVPPPPRMHAVALPGGPAPQPGVSPAGPRVPPVPNTAATTPGAPLPSPALPGAPPRPAAPNTAATTPGAPLPSPALPGAPQHPATPNTAATTPGVPPHQAPVLPGAPQQHQLPTPNTAATTPGAPPHQAPALPGAPQQHQLPTPNTAATMPGAPPHQAPALPGAPQQHQLPTPNTAATTPGAPPHQAPALPGAPQQHQPVPNTAAVTPGAPPALAPPAGHAPGGAAPAPAVAPGVAPPHIAAPSPPAHAAPPPPPAMQAPPVTHNPPPAPPAPHVAAPPPPPMQHAAPPPQAPAVHTPPAPPPVTHNPAPPPPAPHAAAPPPPAMQHAAPPPPAPAVHAAPPPPPAPHVAAPPPPVVQHVAPPAPPPVMQQHTAPPAPPAAAHAAPPPAAQAGKKCEVIAGQQVCR